VSVCPHPVRIGAQAVQIVGIRIARQASLQGVELLRSGAIMSADPRQSDHQRNIRCPRCFVRSQCRAKGLYLPS
jgi:hypothetical protein